MNIFNPIYKVNHLVDNKIHSIYIFNGKKRKEGKKLEEKVTEEKLFAEIFTDKELEYINTFKPEIHFLEESIHIDDTVAVIKMKILNSFKHKESIEEMYLFCDKLEELNSKIIYQILTQNKKTELTKLRLEQVLSNIVGFSVVDQKNSNSNTFVPFVFSYEKEIYDYEDILSLKLEDKKSIIHKLVGQKSSFVENEYPFIINPYKVEGFDSFFEKNTRKSLAQLNSQLLFNTGNILDNNIYLCFAKDVLTYFKDEFNYDSSSFENNILKIYYPFLYSKNIHSLEELKESREDLIEKNKILLNEKTNDLFKTIDMFYNIYNSKKTDLTYLSKGIKSLKVILKPTFPIFIPLEIIFKLIHATESIPLIKLNPSTRQENIFRLFTDGVATDGRKIPYLKKGTIFKFIRTIGKTKSVHLYIETKVDELVGGLSKIPLFCEFDENGFISIFTEFDNELGLLNENQVDELFKKSVNPIIEEINNYLEQSGYKMSLFDNLRDENVEIQQLTYETNIQISKKINLEKIQGCTSAIFNNESSSLKKDIYLRFKRVSNFNKVTSQEAFILEKRNEGYRPDEMVQALLVNFKGELTKKEAEELIIKVANEAQLEKGAFKKEIKVKNNPGFKTILVTDPKSSSVKITVENINDIHYLETIPLYLDTLIRLTQDKKSTHFPLKEIDMLCSSLKEDLPDIVVEIPILESILPDSEIPILEQEQLEEEEQELGEREQDLGERGEREEDLEEEDDENKNAFGLFFGNDDEEEEEEEEEEDENENFKRGGKSEGEGQSEGTSSLKEELEQPNTIRNIDGMSLRNYFQNEIEKKDKTLIIKQPVGNFSIYSKVCQSATKRQPVIISDEELENIQKEHKNFLREEDVIRYGTKKDRQFNYVCPRYWCLKTNTIIEPDELKEVKENGQTILVHPTCGKILPENADSVIPGHYVYEFYKPPKNNPDYKRYPNFQIDKHPDGHCLPCCFDKWKTEARINAKKKCIDSKDEEKENDELEKDLEGDEKGEEKSKEKEKKHKELEDEYVKGPDKFPLSAGRWGYLPPAIQTMLHEVNADCQISKTNTNLKSNHPCLLRHGVEISEKQSFVACISDSIFFAKKMKDSLSLDKYAKILTIKEMRKRIIQSLTIDNFIKYQNGNLVTDFYDKNRTVDIQKYTTSHIYSKLDLTKESDVSFYTRIISAFESFLLFLDDDDSIINHIYLWDIISKPNPSIFPSGINLVILEITNNDITNNVQILCPTNHYSSEFYEARKPTLILLKEDEFYEPIYSLTISGNKNSITKIFSEYDPHLSKTMRTVFKDIIKPLYKAICKPLASMPSIVSMKTPILLYDLIEKLDKYKYTVIKQVMNFKNKIIGVIAKSPTLKTGFIPCYPSAIHENLKENLDYVLMTDNNLWKPYNETFVFLSELVKRSKKKKGTLDHDIPCKPIFKIVEDELIVGILTETNQFIQISEPILESNIYPDYNLPSFKNTNYIIQPKDTSKSMLQTDVLITTADSNNIDKERVEYIQKIKLETNFYNVFRNTIKILLNNYENLKKRESIERELKKEYVLYHDKLKNIHRLLRELVQESIQFIGDENYYKLINNVSTCITKDKNKCDATPHLCVFSNEVGTCNVILPEKNLITSKNNEFIYYNKMADEFLRYPNIRSFMFHSNSYLSFGNLGYNLRDNEIILLQSLLTQEYFETLVPTIKNKYIKNNSYDEAEPILSQIYDNKVTNIDLQDKIDIQDNDCLNIKKTKIVSTLWSEYFPNTFNEVRYLKTVACTFQIIIDLMKKKTDREYSINQIKNDLLDEYKKYLELYKDKIIDILILEGKKTLGEQVKTGSLSFVNFIFSDGYFLTPLDIWLLFQKYRVPCFFISSQYLFQTNYKKHIFLAFSETDTLEGMEGMEEKFVFFMIPGLKPQNIPSYKYIENEVGDAFISMNSFRNPEKYMEMIQEAYRERIGIEDFLRDFSKPTTTKYTKKKPLIIEESDDEEG
jgi:hypothetical protein